jgi:hypothetical protein
MELEELNKMAEIEHIEINGSFVLANCCRCATQRMSGLSPDCEFDFLTARARSINISAPAKNWVSLCGIKNSLSFQHERKLAKNPIKERSGFLRFTPIEAFG